MNRLRWKLAQWGWWCDEGPEGLLVDIGRPHAAYILPRGEEVQLLCREELPAAPADPGGILALLEQCSGVSAEEPVFRMEGTQTIGAAALCPKREVNAVAQALTRMAEVLPLLADCADGRRDAAGELARLERERREQTAAARTEAERQLALLLSDVVWEKLVHARWQDPGPWPAEWGHERLYTELADSLRGDEDWSALGGEDAARCALARRRALQRTRLQYVRLCLMVRGLLPQDAPWPAGYGPGEKDRLP